MNIADKAVIISVYSGMEQSYRAYMRNSGLDIPIISANDVNEEPGGKSLRDLLIEQIKKGKEIFIARGMVAKVVRQLGEEFENINLIEVFVSGIDILQVLHKYVGYPGKIAFIECDTFTEKVREVSAILGIHVSIYEVKGPGLYNQAYHQAVEDGMDVIIGAGREEYYYTAEHNRHCPRPYRGDMVESSELAIRQSVDSAYHLFEQIYEEKRNNDLLRTILNYSTEGIISLDQDQVISALNDTVAKELELTQSSLLGRPLAQAIPDLAPLLRGSDIARDLIWTVSDRQFVVSRVPVLVGGEKSGDILFLQPARKLLEAERSLRRQQEKKGLTAKWVFGDIQTCNPGMLSTIDIAKRYSEMDSTILITGETGVGKEMFAQSIHNSSRRSAGAFVAINCSALAPTLLESELFGYAEGSFTGALKSGKMGIFERAHRGTIFLDEIGEIDLSLQAKLLRVLQERQVMRLGDDRVIPIDVKVIAATNKDLKRETLEGRFRSDLYYRINVLNLYIPPLRERKEDLPLLTASIIDRLNRSLKCKVTGLDERLQQALWNYDWPGNIRELNNVLEKAVVLTQWGQASYEKVRPALRELDCPGEQPGPASGPEGSLAEVERACILSRLRQCGGNKVKTAQSLGIGYATLLRKLKSYSGEIGQTQ